MELALTIFLFLLGIVLIVKGGDWFVDAASWIAEATGIPKFIVGATVVSFATTLPELIVSLIATINGKVDMAIGNAVGSVTANTGLILAISLICLPSMLKRKQFLAKGMILIASCAGLLLLCQGGQLNIVPSLILIALFALFMVENVLASKQMKDDQPKMKADKKELPKNILLFVVGAAGIVIGARLLVDNGSSLARLIGIPESIIGLTFVAIGTSLPELVTTITAIVKKQSALSVGNIIGANIIDLTLILPACALAAGGTLPVQPQSALFDMPVCLILTCVALVPSLITGKFQKWQGFVLLAGYITYVLLLVL